VIQPDAHRSLPAVIAPLIAIAAAVVLQVTVRRWLGDYVERIMLDATIAVTLAVSLNIVNGYTGQFSIGHAAFFAIGGYAAAMVTYYGTLLIWNHTYAIDPWQHPEQWTSFALQQAMFIAATIFGGLVAAGAGWLVGLPSLRLRGDYLAIVTLGFGEIVRVLLQQTNHQVYSQQELHEATWQELVFPVGGALGFINIPKITTLFWTTLAAGITLIVAWRLKKSTFGRSMIAIRENEIAAEAMGVNVTRLKVWAFVFAAFFAGVAGSMYAHEPGVQMAPTDAGFIRSFDIVIMVVLGGLGSISGAALAAVLITFANEWLRDPTQAIHFGSLSVEVWWIVLGAMALRLILFPQNRLKSIPYWTTAVIAVAAATWASRRWNLSLGEYRMILYALALILVMILRPRGLFGTAEVTDIARERQRKPLVPAFEVVR
jgi:branched-chain amino acid transport system permease protein